VAGAARHGVGGGARGWISSAAVVELTSRGAFESVAVLEGMY
jgi:hypothetical protein